MAGNRVANSLAASVMATIGNMTSATADSSGSSPRAMPRARDFQRAHSAHDRAGIAEQHDAFRREFRRAAGLVEQHDTDAVLEGGDGLADDGLRPAQSARGG